jgi:single-strand DNA-binding protein
MHEETTFGKVELYGKLATTARQYLAKGHPVIFEGRLKLNTWQSKDGKQQSELVIAAENMEFLPRGERSAAVPQPTAQSSHSDRGQYAPPAMPRNDHPGEVPEDDIPF